MEAMGSPVCRRRFPGRWVGSVALFLAKHAVARTGQRRWPGGGAAQVPQYAIETL